MYQDSEVVSLVMCLISAVFIGRFRNRDIPQFRYFYWGLLLMCVSFVGTVAEGFLWPDLFNAIEHLSSAVSGLLFAVACFNLMRAGETVQGEAVDLRLTEGEGVEAVVWVKAN